jgi:lysozyme family protein
MSDFNTAVSLVLKHEGGLVDNPSDPGGLTNYGIALNRHPELTADDIRNMTVDRAKAIYQKQYWTAAMEQEPDQRMANALLDTAVNQGPSVAEQFYQHFGHSVKEFQLARLLRYANLISKKPTDIANAHSWFQRALDI